MSDIRYRLIFNGTAPVIDMKRLLSFLQRDIGLSNDQIQKVMTSPPRVLQEYDTQHSAELTQSTLTKMGCLTTIDQVIAYPGFPYTISEKHDRLIKKELSKVLRCRTSLVILLVQIEEDKPSAHLPSLMGSFEEQLIDSFRDSDTVISLDDTRLIVLGFATDRQGIPPFQSKVQRIIKKLLGDDIKLKLGYAIFAEEGQTLPNLLQLAVLPRKENGVVDLPDIAKTGPQKPGASLPAEGEKSDVTPLQSCFTRARGRIFARLLNMDPQTLWLGLNRIPQAQQKEFLARLPFDSPLTPELEVMINSQPKSLADQVAENHFNAVIHQMQLELGLKERDELLDKVQSKLTHSEDLPTLPSVATHIFKIASSPTASGTELAAIIMRDPALTSKLLKTVNSAFYGNPQKISSIKQAVVLLGTDEIVDIAFGLAAAKVFDVKPLKGLIDPKSLWHHALCTALIVQQLSRSLPQYRDVGVFTAGLLHDVGKIFLIEKFTEMYKETYTGTAKYQLPLFELEEDHFGMSHAMVGKHLASRWNLPEPLVQAIAYHHQPFGAPSHSGLAAVTGLADYLYYRVAPPERKSQEDPGHTHWLTVGHWIFLTQIYKDMSTHKLDEMAREAEKIIEQNREYLDLLS